MKKSNTETMTAGLSFHCVPHQMPIHEASGCWEAGEGETPTYTKQRSLLCCSQRGEGELERGREGGKDVKRDVRNVIMRSLPEKCRCFSE